MFYKILMLSLFFTGCGFKKKNTEPNPPPVVEQPTEPRKPVPLPKPKPIPTPPKPKPDPVPPTDGDVSGLVSAMNKARADRGLAAVTIELGLNCAAQRHAKDVGPKNLCSHTGTDGSDFTKRARDCNTSALAEILACGQGSAEQAVQAWTFSPLHAAILYGPSTVVGVGMVNNHWVAVWR